MAILYRSHLKNGMKLPRPQKIRTIHDAIGLSFTELFTAQQDSDVGIEFERQTASTSAMANR